MTQGVDPQDGNRSGSECGSDEEEVPGRSCRVLDECTARDNSNGTTRQDFAPQNAQDVAGQSENPSSRFYIYIIHVFAQTIQNIIKPTFFHWMW